MPRGCKLFLSDRAILGRMTVCISLRAPISRSVQLSVSQECAFSKQNRTAMVNRAGLIFLTRGPACRIVRDTESLPPLPRDPSVHLLVTGCLGIPVFWPLAFYNINNDSSWFLICAISASNIYIYNELEVAERSISFKYRKGSFI